ncbi:MAG: hypothetical protein UHM85_11200 [Acutalibacteraceae bacterium]|nr:hypothetical protein [Acutalibacteraceae bacterium]
MGNNKFFDFVEKYWADIAAFFKAFREFVEALMGKMNAEDTEAPEA